MRMRAINHYRMDGEDPSVVASGHTVFDLAWRGGSGVESAHFALDNLTDRDYYELRTTLNRGCRGRRRFAHPRNAGVSDFCNGGDDVRLRGK